IRDVNQIKPTAVAKQIARDSAICQNGGVSVTIRTSIVMGAKNGNIDDQKASGEFGLRIILNERKRPAMSISTTGIASCPPSWVVVTIVPTSAQMVASLIYLTKTQPP